MTSFSKMPASERRRLSAANRPRRPAPPSGSLPFFDCPVRLDPVEDFLAVDAVGEVGPAAERVQPERRHGDDRVRIESAEKYGAAGVARACAAAGSPFPCVCTLKPPLFWLPRFTRSTSPSGASEPDVGNGGIRVRAQGQPVAADGEHRVFRAARLVEAIERPGIGSWPYSGIAIG